MPVHNLMVYIVFSVIVLRFIEIIAIIVLHTSLALNVRKKAKLSKLSHFSFMPSFVSMKQQLQRRHGFFFFK